MDSFVDLYNVNKAIFSQISELPKPTIYSKSK